MKISIIIPAYNEERRIGKTLEAYLDYFENLRKKKVLDYEILVVINNTRDKTEEIVKDYAKKNKNLIHLNLKDGGKGYALIEGFKDTLKRENDLIGFVDADMSTSPEAFYKLVCDIGKNDCAIASRGLNESVVKTSLKRKITHKGFNFLVRSILFLPYHDTQCGAKLFHKKTLKSVIDKLGVTQWGFDVDLLYKIRRAHFKIIEIPTIWEDKGDSKLNLIKVPFQMFSALIRLRLIYSPFNFFVRLYDKLPARFQIHGIVALGFFF